MQGAEGSEGVGGGGGSGVGAGEEAVLWGWGWREVNIWSWDGQLRKEHGTESEVRSKEGSKFCALGARSATVKSCPVCGMSEQDPSTALLLTMTRTNHLLPPREV